MKKPYRIKQGHKFVVSNPDAPGQTVDRLGGDVIELDEAEAAEYSDRVEAIKPNAPVDAPALEADAPHAAE